MDVVKLRSQLAKHEGLRLVPYRDTVGVWTVGYGHNLNCGISRAIAEAIFTEDISNAIALLEQHCPWWTQLDDVRQRVLVDMAFNLGERLLPFVRTLAAVKEGRYEDAAAGMLASTWAKQVGSRAVRLAEMMRTGKDAPQ